MVVIDTLALIHLSGLRCNDVTRVDLGARSGCHSDVLEIKAVYFTRFGRFAHFGRFASFGGFVLLGLFRCFGF